MTRKTSSVLAGDWKGTLQGQKDFLKPLVAVVVQETLEAEMAQTVGAAPYERTEDRRGSRSRYCRRSLITRVGLEEFATRALNEPYP